MGTFTMETMASDVPPLETYVELMMLARVTGHIAWETASHWDRGDCLHLFSVCMWVCVFIHSCVFSRNSLNNKTDGKLVYEYARIQYIIPLCVCTCACVRVCVCVCYSPSLCVHGTRSEQQHLIIRLVQVRWLPGVTGKPAPWYLSISTFVCARTLPVTAL